MADCFCCLILGVLRFSILQWLYEKLRSKMTWNDLVLVSWEEFSNSASEWERGKDFRYMLSCSCSLVWHDLGGEIWFYVAYHWRNLWIPIKCNPECRYCSQMLPKMNGTLLHCWTSEYIEHWDSFSCQKLPSSVTNRCRKVYRRVTSSLFTPFFALFFWGGGVVLMLLINLALKMQ